MADLFEWLTTKIGAIAGIFTALGVICAALLKVRTYFSRSRLITPNAFPLPEIPSDQAIFAKDLADLSTLLVGRERDIRSITRAIQDHPLTFLYGESGSGKSTLLKLGIARDLAQSGTCIPIYIDIWGQDWIRGPQSSLASATDFALRALALSTDQPVTRETVLFRLSELRSKTGRQAVLLFDQIDDYQVAHRDRFRDSDTGLFLGPGELCEANPFWQGVRDLLSSDDDSVHAILVTRDDAKAGLHCFEFLQTRVYPLARLDSADAEQLIHRLAPETVVKNPESGFRDLMERVVKELGRNHGDKILPMQLRIALAGIGRITSTLTPSRFEKLGGVAGLGAQYVESATRGLPDAWPILNAMAERSTDGSNKAIALTRAQVLLLVPSGNDIDPLLQTLFEARILRHRLVGSQEESWQLYHDYLADACVALENRKRRWTLFLANAAGDFRRGGSLFQKWNKLLKPLVQIRLFWHRFHDRSFRFGEYVGFVRLSMLRLLINVWICSAIAIWVGYSYWSEARTATEISNAFLQGGDSEMEFHALWHLAAIRSNRARRLVFEQLLSTHDGARRLDENLGPAIATLGLKSSTFDELHDVPRSGVCATLSYTDSCITLSLIFEPSKLPQAGYLILDRMKATTDVVELARFARLLAKMTTASNEQQAEPGAVRILDQMKSTKDSLDLGELGGGLASLGKVTRGMQSEAGAQLILNRMQISTNPVNLIQLGSPLEDLAKETNGEQAMVLAKLIVDQMENTTDAVHLGSLNGALVALAKGAAGQQADLLRELILERLKRTTNLTQAFYLKNALAFLPVKMVEKQVQAGSQLILGQIKDTTDKDRLRDLGAALTALTTDMNENQAYNLVELILDRMKSMPDAPHLDSLGPALTTAVEKIGENQAHHLGDLILDQMKNTTSFDDMANLGLALAKLAKLTGAKQAESGAELILIRMENTTDPTETAVLGKVLGALVTTTNGKQAERGSQLIVNRMKDKINVDDMSRLGIALAELTKTTDGKQIEIGTKLVVARLKGGSSDDMSRLGEALAAIAGAKDEKQRRYSILIELANLPVAFDCASATTNATREELPLLVDMLKWPSCGNSREGLMSRVARLVGQDPKIYGTSDGTNDPIQVHEDLRTFIVWLKDQRDAEGKTFDTDSPPLNNPYFRPEGRRR